MKLLSLKIPGGPGGGSTDITPPPGIPSGLSLGHITSALLDLILIFGVIVSMVYFAYGGIFWIQSKGNKETLDKARRIIIYSVMGLILMSLSLVIVNLISNALGVQTLIGQ